MVTIPLLATLAMVTTPLPDQGFKQIADTHGVRVFRRDPQKGIELGAEGDIDAPPAAVRAALLDYEGSARWVKGLKESRIISRDDRSLHVYQRLDLPIIDDRDFTLYVTWGEAADAPGTLWLRFQVDNDQGPPPSSGVVRVYTHEGGWVLTPLDGGRRTHASYHFHLDLAGALPGWMGKGKAAKEMPTLFDNVRREAMTHLH